METRDSDCVNEAKAERALLKANRDDMNGLAKEFAGMSPKQLTDCARRIKSLSIYQEKHVAYLPIVEIKFDDHHRFAGAKVLRDGKSSDYDAQGKKIVDKPGDKAADKPGDQAADKPGDKAADKPGDKPAGQPGDKAAGAISAEERQKQEQALLDKLDEHGKHWYPGGGTDRAKMVQDIENMTPEQQQLYRTDKDFQRKVDDKLKGDMVPHVSISKHDEDALHAAQHFLDKVKNSKGETQKPDLTSKLLKHAAEERWSFSDEEQRQAALNDLNEAEKHDPTLRKRIATGTDADSVELRRAAKQALGDEEYEKYIHGSNKK